MASETHGMKHAEQARLVTRQFHGLQGYTLLPWVPAMLLWWGSEAGALRGDWWAWAFLASLVGAALGSWWVQRWYARTYGNVRRQSASLARGLGIAVLVVLGAYGLIAVLSVTGVWPLDPGGQPVSWVGAVAGIALALAGWRMRPLTTSTWRFGITMAVISLVPLGLMGPFDGTHPFNADGAMMGVVAAFSAVVGIASHRALDRTLATPSDSHGSPGA